MPRYFKENLIRNNLLNDLKNKEWRPIYFLMGQETYFIEQLSLFFEKKLLEEKQKAFDQVVFYGSKSNIDDVILEAKRYPILGKYLLILVKEAEELAKLDQLVTYLNAFNPSTIMVLCYRHKMLDKKKDLYKLLKKNNWIFEFKKIYNDQVPIWIQDRVTELGHIISYENALFLAEYVGNDLLSIENQLKKLISGLNKATNELTQGYIEKQITYVKQYHGFELQKALSDKNPIKAYRIVFSFLKDSRYSMVFILGMLYNFFTKLLCYHAMMPCEKETIIDHLGISAYTIKEYEIAYRNYPLEKILVILSSIKKADISSKGIDNAFLKEEEIIKELFFIIFSSYN